jgi:prephenate dehydratase
LSKRIAYLGPPGTFAEQAALLHDPEAQLMPFRSIPAVAEAVASAMAQEGVVPVENSIEGSVTDTLDLLIHESTLSICRELVIPINHCLLLKPGAGPERLDAIFSHPQALAQCRRFLERCFPNAQQIASLSTAAAVEEMLSRDNAGAIATQRAAELYGAEILAKGIQDQSSNVTRFAVLAQADHGPTGYDKTSLCFATREDRPGALVEVLKEFSDRGINLTKIESRPSKEVLGQYIFLADLEGHREDPEIADALKGVKEKTMPERFKIFGSYPRYSLPRTQS